MVFIKLFHTKYFSITAIKIDIIVKRYSKWLVKSLPRIELMFLKFRDREMGQVSSLLTIDNEAKHDTLIIAVDSLYCISLEWE